MRRLDATPLRFFGSKTPGAPRMEVPLGLSCWECGKPFQPDDSGVAYVRGPIHVASHRQCFVRNAIRDLHKAWADDESVS